MALRAPQNSGPPKQLPVPTLEPAVGTHTSLAENWKVIFHNDDVTTFEFVIGALMRFFGHEGRKALELTYEIHRSGCAVVASKAGGLVDVVDDKHTGLLVDPGQPQALCDALRWTSNTQPKL